VKKGKLNKEIFIAAILSGESGVRAIVFSGSLARTYWSRAAVASRLLKKVKKDGLFQQIQSKLSLIMNSITEEDLKNAKLREKVQSARVIGEIANKLLK